MSEAPAKRPRSPVRRWVHRAFLVWAVGSTWWLADTFRTRDVPEAMLRSDASVTVRDGEETLAFLPASPARPAALAFLCGGGVAAEAYAPLLRPLAERGHPVVVVRLPWRLAPLPSHKGEAVARARRAMARHPGPAAWVVAGHSLGGALACRLVAESPASVDALVLVGTTHPKRDDLSGLTLPVTKVHGTRDGVAPPEKVEANAPLLPPHTRWVRIDGGNHSRFGHYGHQLFDGEATISRAEQQELTRAALLRALEEAADR